MEAPDHQSTAVFVRTESSDEYLYAFPDWKQREEVLEWLKAKMGEEYNYICKLVIKYSE